VVVIEGERTLLQRPTLLGAILLKARSLNVHSRPEDQREDLVTLLGLLSDPRSVLPDLNPKERKWLLAAESKLKLHDRDLDGRFDAVQLRVARASFARLTSDRL